MHRLLLELPDRLETERLYLRSYQAGDGRWYYPMSQRNRRHLQQYESGNPIMTIKTEEDAEITVRDFAAAWIARQAFFLAAFTRGGEDFVAQVYIGPVNWELPEFEIGYFADVDHQGHGYVTESVHACQGFIFRHLGAHRVRLECDDTNTKSWQVAERCGLLREAHLRENKKQPDGSFTGTLVYGLLRSEFAGLS